MTSPSSIADSRQVPDASKRLPAAIAIQSRESGDASPISESPAQQVALKASPFARSWAHFFAGGLGGMISATLTAPLDVVKTRLQSSDFYQAQIAAWRAAKNIPHPSQMSLARSSLLHIRETCQILYAIPKIEGPRALFKGLGPNLIGVVPARAINFYAYGNGKKIISQNFNNGQESAWVHLTAAACAGIVTGTATNPIWLVKTRLHWTNRKRKMVEADNTRMLSTAR